jgi:cobalt-precorrin-5B (C1)-methyltransferase
MAVKTGFKKMLFCGHIGKLVKVAGGIKNTHSKYGDHRMEIISDVAKNLFEEGLLKGISSDEQLSSIVKELSACITTEQAVNILDSIDSPDSNGAQNHETRNKIMQEIAKRIKKNMEAWSDGKLKVEVIVFTKEHGLLAQTGRPSI